MLRMLWSAGLGSVLLMLGGLFSHHAWLWGPGIALALLTAACVGLLLRSLPRLEGVLHLPGLEGPVEVRRDEWGVGHIRAENELDLYFAQGYVTASDRLWQMDILRRVAAGRLAEVLGHKALAHDRFFRNLGLQRAAAKSEAELDPAVRAATLAFARGVSARMNAQRLPLEFALLRYRPEPWTVLDSLSVAKLMAFTLDGSWRSKLLQAAMVQQAGVAKTLELLPAAPPPETLEWLDELAKLKLPNLNTIDQLVRPFQLNTTGSAWAVAGSRSKSGKPLLAAAPLLPATIPCSWYEVHLTLPGDVDVMGVTLPGVPGVMLGRNRQLAWSLNSADGDAQEVYIEKRDPRQPAHLLYQGLYRQAEVRDEAIRVRGRAPIAHQVLVSRYGPVIAPLDPLGQDANHPHVLALGWAGLGASLELEGIYRINRAKDWPEFHAALRHMAAPLQMWLCACTDGTIASKVTGKIPVRTRGDGQVPVPGWTGKWACTGYVPFDGLPECVNPAEGYLIAAREYQKLRIGQRLQGGKLLAAPEMQHIQRDCANLQAHALLPLLLQASQQAASGLKHAYSPLEQHSRMLLATWDWLETADSPAPLLYHHWLAHTLEELLRPSLPQPLLEHYLAAGNPLATFDRLVRRVMEGESSAFCSLDPTRDDSFQQACLRAFRRTVAILSARHGPVPERWRWASEHTLRARHLLTLALPLLTPLLRARSHPLAGGPTTVSAAGYRPNRPFAAAQLAPWRFVADLAEHGGHAAMLSGQSGHVLSVYFQNQLGLWLEGGYRTQHFAPGSLKDAHLLKLLPPALE